jgi:hypothetical protein
MEEWRIESVDLDRAIAAIGKSVRWVESKMQAVMEELMDEFVEKAAEESPRGDKWREHDPRRTGPQFYTLWEAEVTRQRGRVIGELINTHPAAKAIVFGREDPWLIQAKTPKGMSFPWEAIDWDWVYGARQVVHPSMPGAETHLKALELMSDEIDAKFRGLATEMTIIIAQG